MINNLHIESKAHSCCRGKVRKSLAVSFWDGLFCSCMSGLTADYIAPYALALKATNSQIGILGAAPQFAAALCQLKSADMSEKFKSRKKFFVTFVLLHALMGIPIILVPWVIKEHAVWWIIFFVSLFTCLNSFCAPAWSSLMSEYIPMSKRGKYFGWRNKVMGIITSAAALLAGLTLSRYKENVILGFTVVFTFAVIFRFISWYFLTKMYEPGFKSTEQAYFSFFDFIRRLRHSNFAKFVLFFSSVIFCVNIASPFFSVYMLRELKLNYLSYTVIVTTVTLTNIFTFDRWGRHADKVGNVRIFKLTAYIIASLPLWWIFYQHPLYLIGIQVLSGFAWSGFNLCATNFIYDAVTPEKRTRCIAYFNVCVGIATCAGALLGSLLLNFIPELFSSRILSLFLLSSALRFTAIALLLHRVREVRSTVKVASRDLFYSVVGIRPMFGPDKD